MQTSYLRPIELKDRQELVLTGDIPRSKIDLFSDIVADIQIFLKDRDNLSFSIPLQTTKANTRYEGIIAAIGNVFPKLNKGLKDDDPRIIILDEREKDALSKAIFSAVTTDFVKEFSSIEEAKNLHSRKMPDVFSEHFAEVQFENGEITAEEYFKIVNPFSTSYKIKIIDKDTFIARYFKEGFLEKGDEKYCTELQIKYQKNADGIFHPITTYGGCKLFPVSKSDENDYTSRELYDFYYAQELLVHPTEKYQQVIGYFNDIFDHSKSDDEKAKSKGRLGSFLEGEPHRPLPDSGIEKKDKNGDDAFFTLKIKISDTRTIILPITNLPEGVSKKVDKENVISFLEIWKNYINTEIGIDDYFNVEQVVKIFSFGVNQHVWSISDIFHFKGGFSSDLINFMSENKNNHYVIEINNRNLSEVTAQHNFQNNMNKSFVIEGIPDEDKVFPDDERIIKVSTNIDVDLSGEKIAIKKITHGQYVDGTDKQLLNNTVVYGPNGEIESIEETFDLQTASKCNELVLAKMKEVESRGRRYPDTAVTSHTAVSVPIVTQQEPKTPFHKKHPKLMAVLAFGGLALATIGSGAALVATLGVAAAVPAGALIAFGIGVGIIALIESIKSNRNKMPTTVRIEEVEPSSAEGREVPAVTAAETPAPSAESESSSDVRPLPKQSEVIKFIQLPPVTSASVGPSHRSLSRPAGTSLSFSDQQCSYFPGPDGYYPDEKRPAVASMPVQTSRRAATSPQ